MRQQQAHAPTTGLVRERAVESERAAHGGKETKESSLVRGPKPGRKRMMLTARDQNIVRWINDVGVSTREQVQALFFGRGSRSRCQRRLTLLFSNWYLDKLPRRRATLPDVYYLSRRCTNGLRLLRAAGLRPVKLRPPSPMRLPHLLDVISCRVQITRACAERGVQLIHWLDERDLIDLVASEELLPDAFFRLCRRTAKGEEKRSSFFLEVERSDKGERTLAEKFRRYGDFYYNGAFERRFGTRSLRVLVLLGSDYGIVPEKRVAKLAGLAEREGVTFLHFAPVTGFLTTHPRDVLTKAIWTRVAGSSPIALFPED